MLVQLARHDPRRVAPRPTPRARDVALVCMPFADPRYPSVALATLAEALREEGHRADVLHLHVEAAAALGLARYYDLQGGTSWYHLIGEWLFAHPSITPGAADEATFRRYLGPFEGSLEVDMGYFARRAAVSGGVSLFDAMELGAVKGALERLLDRWIDAHDFARYDVVGFTVVFQQLNASLRLARAIKDRHPHVRVVLGGAALEPPMGAAVAARYPWVDAVFGGFADRSFPAYVRDLPEPGERYVVHEGDPIVLDDLPVPRYDDYFEAIERTGLRRRLEPRVPLETSRGCWWGEKKHCTFCGFNANEMWFRQKSTARAKREVRALARYGEPLYFVDNIIPMDYVRELFPALADEGTPLPGGFLFTKSNIDRAELASLARAGLTWIQPGIESLSTPILRHMEKGVRGVQNVWFLRACEELGVHPVWAILYGFPGEDRGAYEEMARVLPSLAHLPAPTGAYRILMARYSPIHTGAERLGLTDVAPTAAYSHAFGPHERLAEQAYTFDYRSADGTLPEEYAAGVVEGAARWTALRQLPLAPRCEVVRAFGARFLYDSRRRGEVGRARPRVRRLDDLEWRVLEALESPRTPSRLAAALADGGAHHAVVARLIEEGLLLALDGRLVRLVVVREDPSPLRELSRVVADKARQLRYRGVLTQQRRAALRREVRAALSLATARARALIRP